MARPLPRTRRLEERARDQAKIDKLLEQTAKHEAVIVAGGALPDDRRRGIPAIGRGVRGAIAGSVPGQRLA